MSHPGTPRASRCGPQRESRRDLAFGVACEIACDGPRASPRAVSRAISRAKSASCAHAFAALAAHAPGLATLDIGANCFGRAAGPLLQLLPVYPSLTELDASGNELSDWGAEVIATALLAMSASLDDLFSYAARRRRPDCCHRGAPYGRDSE